MSEHSVEPPERGRGSVRRTRQDRADLYKLAYEEGKRLVDDQLSELDTMRQRSVQFLAFVGSASAFLVGTSLKASDRTTIFYVLAIGASVLTLLTVFLCLSLLTASTWQGGDSDVQKRGALRFLPHAEQWAFRLSPKALVQWIEPDVRQPSESDYYRALAERYEGMARENSQSLNKMRNRYVGFLAAAVLQLTLWLVLAWLYG